MWKGEEAEHELAIPEEEHTVLQPVEERGVELSADRALPDADERLPGEREGRGLVEPKGVSSKAVKPQYGADTGQTHEDQEVPGKVQVVFRSGTPRFCALTRVAAVIRNRGLGIY
jgi:hypothetical protein